MAKQEFIRSLHAARNFMFHQAAADARRRKPEDAAPSPPRPAMWLTPASVRGFDLDYFRDLPEAVQLELAQGISDFVRVSQAVGQSGPPTPQQLEDATRSFMSILRIMEPYLPTSDETRRLRAAMSELPFPPEVLTWEFEFGRDSTGEAAVWIWVLVDDAAANDARFTTTSDRLQREIRQSLQRTGLDRWPYVRFRTASEQKALQAAGR
jgi:hypothetical protein